MTNEGDESPAQEPFLPLLDKIAAAELLGIGHHYLAANYKKLKVPYYKIGGNILFSRRDLEDWIKRFRIEPKDDLS